MSEHLANYLRKIEAAHRLGNDTEHTHRPSLQALLSEFLNREPVRIEGAEELARRLARLTHLIRDTMVASFQSGQASELLTGWRSVFAQTLLPALAETGHEAEFADMFAQTLAYGLFSARALTSTSGRFTLAEAAQLIPKTNPFLRDLLHSRAGRVLYR